MGSEAGIFVRGESRAKKFLSRAIKKDRVPSSVILVGDAGTGKTRLGLEASMSFLCLEGRGWACGKCASCRLIKKVGETILSGVWGDISVVDEKSGKKRLLMLRGEHPDFIYVPPDDGSVRIEQVRAVKEFAYSKPAFSGSKAVFIERVDLMTREASNALLKVLEEPPASTRFIMSSESEEALLETILSRSVVLPMEVPEFSHFREITGLDSREIYDLVRGSPSKASLLKKHEDIIKMSRLVFEGGMSEAYGAITRADTLDSEVKELFIELLEDRLERMVLSGELGYEAFDKAERLLLDLRTGLKRGIKLSPCLFSLREIVEG